MRPTFKRLRIKVDSEYTEEKKLESGLYMPAVSAAKMKFWTGTVIEAGAQVTPEIKIGDKVVFPPNSGIVLEDGTRLIDDTTVLGILDT